MATYLQGVTPYIPQIQPFQEDFNFYANVLQQKQSQYDANYKALNDVYGQYFYADMLREDNLERKAELIKTIDQNLRKASGTDLSLQQNVNAAKQIFRPFYEDKALMKDIAFTKTYKNELGRAQSLKNCVGGDCPDGYWDGGVRLLHHQAEDFKNAAADKALNIQNPTYTPYVNVMKEANAAVKAAGFKITYEASNGRYMVKTENGNMAIGPLRDFLIQNFGNDPRFVDFYKAQADLTLREQPEQAIDIYEQQMLRKQAKTPEEYQRLVKQRAEEKALVRSKEYINTVATNAKKDSEESELFSKSWEEYAAANQGLLPPDAARAEEARTQAQVSKQTYEQVSGLANSVNNVAYYDRNGQRISDDMIKQTVASALMLSDLENTATTIAQATFSQTIKGADPYALAQYRSDLSLRNYTQKKIIDLVATLDPNSSTPKLADNAANRNRFNDKLNKEIKNSNKSYTEEEKEQLYQEWLNEQGLEKAQAIKNIQDLSQGKPARINSKAAQQANSELAKDPNPSEQMEIVPNAVTIEPPKSDGKPSNYLPKAFSNLTGITNFEAVYEDETENKKSILGLTKAADYIINKEDVNDNEFELKDAIAYFNHMASGHISAFNVFREAASGMSKNYNNELINIFKNKLTDPNFENTAALIYKEIKNTFIKEVEFPEKISNENLNTIVNALEKANDENSTALFKNFTATNRILSEEEAVKNELMTSFSKNPFSIGKIIEKTSEAFKYSLDKDIKLKALGIDTSDENMIGLQTIIAQDEALKEKQKVYNQANRYAIDLMIAQRLPQLTEKVLGGSESNAGKFTATKYAWNPKAGNGYGGIASPSYMFNKLIQNDLRLVNKYRISKEEMQGGEAAVVPSSIRSVSGTKLTKLTNDINLDDKTIKILIKEGYIGSMTHGKYLNFSEKDIYSIQDNNLIINNKIKIPTDNFTIAYFKELKDFIPSEKQQKNVLVEVFKALVAKGSRGNVPGEGSMFEGTTKSDWDKTIPTMHSEFKGNSMENNESDFKIIKGIANSVVNNYGEALKTFTGNAIPRATDNEGNPLTKQQANVFSSVLTQLWKSKDQKDIPTFSIDIQPMSEHGTDVAKVTWQFTGGDEGLRNKLRVTTNSTTAKDSQKKANPLMYVPETVVFYVKHDEVEEFQQIQRNIAVSTLPAGKILGDKNQDDVYIEINKQTSDAIDYTLHMKKVYNPETNKYEAVAIQDSLSTATKENVYNYFYRIIALNKHLQNYQNKSNK